MPRQFGGTGRRERRSGNKTKDAKEKKSHRTGIGERVITGEATYGNCHSPRQYEQLAVELLKAVVVVTPVLTGMASWKRTKLSQREGNRIWLDLTRHCPNFLDRGGGNGESESATDPCGPRTEGRLKSRDRKGFS